MSKGMLGKPKPNQNILCIFCETQLKERTKNKISGFKQALVSRNPIMLKTVLLTMYGSSKARIVRGYILYFCYNLNLQRIMQLQCNFKMFKHLQTTFEFHCLLVLLQNKKKTFFWTELESPQKIQIKCSSHESSKEKKQESNIQSQLIPANPSYCANQVDIAGEVKNTVFSLSTPYTATIKSNFVCICKLIDSFFYYS